MAMRIKDLSPHIKNLIIDLGGVLLNIDYQASKREFEALGVEDFDAHFSQMAQSHLFDRFETGKISADDFIDAIRKEGEIGSTDDEIIRAWNAMLLDFPLRRLEILEELSKEYKLYLFSNTNAIHILEFHRYLQEIGMLERFHSVFDKVYYSYAFGHRKPLPESFSALLEAEALQASECFFVDDSPQHIEGAQKAGIKSRLVTGGIESIIL